MSNEVLRLMSVIEVLLERLIEVIGPDADAYDYGEWEELRDAFSDIQHLTAGTISHNGHWSNMLRHLSVGQKMDLYDIVNLDWPSVSSEIRANLIPY